MAQRFVRSYLEREIPMLGPRIPAETLESLWTMLAHNQSGLLNASRLATALMASAQTTIRHIDLLVDLLLVRRLRPFHHNAGKRIVKASKVYVRDSGIVLPTTTRSPGTRSSAPVGKASSSKISLPPSRNSRRQASIGHLPAPKSISCWKSPATDSGLSMSSVRSRPGLKRAFTMPARI